MRLQVFVGQKWSTAWHFHKFQPSKETMIVDEYHLKFSFIFKNHKAGKT